MQDKNVNKTAIVIEDMRIGGPQKQLIYLLQEIEKDNTNFNYTIILPRNTSKKILTFLKFNRFIFEELEIQYLSRYNLFNYIKFFIKDLRQLKVKLKNIDKVYIAGGTSNLKSIIISIILKKEIYLHIHDVRSNIIIKFAIFIVSKFIKKVFFASESSKQYYSFINKKVGRVVLRSSIDPSYYKGNIVKKGFFTIGVVANINPDKNFELLIDIIKNIEDKNIRFKIIGKLFGSQKKYFEDKLSNFREVIHKIEWINDINDTKEIMKSFDILLCTSSNESLPLSIIEALSMSIPVISTNVGDIAYVLSQKKCGIIVKPFANHFIKAIYNLKNNQELINIYSKNARDNVIENFNIKNYKKKLEKEIL